MTFFKVLYISWHFQMSWNFQLIDYFLLINLGLHGLHTDKGYAVIRGLHMFVCWRREQQQRGVPAASTLVCVVRQRVPERVGPATGDVEWDLPPAASCQRQTSDSGTLRACARCLCELRFFSNAVICVQSVLVNIT